MKAVSNWGPAPAARTTAASIKANRDSDVMRAAVMPWYKAQQLNLSRSIAATPVFEVRTIGAVSEASCTECAAESLHRAEIRSQSTRY